MQFLEALNQQWFILGMNGGIPIGASEDRITEDGELRITEDGQQRVTEGS